jgi:hypothetical protein
MRSRAPACGRELAGFDPRFLHPPLAFQPELMLPELAPPLGEMPSLTMLEPGRKSLGVARLSLDSLFVALSFFEAAHSESTNENAAVAMLIETVLKCGRRNILLSFGAPSKRAWERAAQSKEQHARKKPSTQCPYPMAIQTRALFGLKRELRRNCLEPKFGKTST